MKRKTTHQNDSQSSDATDSSNKRSKNFEQLEKKHVRNPGIPLDMAWVNEAKVNCPAVKRRVASHSKRRCVKKGTQLGWLLRTISLIDLTTLGGMDSESNVNRLCAKAKTPLIADYVKALELENKNVKVGAVCVYPNRVAEAVKALEGSGIGVASVAAGFPAGQTPLDLRLTEIERAVAAGASEIDIVLSRNLVLQGKVRACV
jgi:deoxyribose-phosphate aldolase